MKNKRIGFLLPVLTCNNKRSTSLFLMYCLYCMLSAIIVFSYVGNIHAASDEKPFEIEFVLVKGGCYLMGDTFGEGGEDEKPPHEVCVDDFYIGKYEVTQGQWQAVMGNNPSNFKNCGTNCPVEQVSWEDTQQFITKLNNAAGSKKYRLPTEAEWEYAARSGGKKEKYSGGSDIGSVAWYDGNSGKRTHPVGEKQPNGLGIYDMSGNVWELVQDWYNEKAYSSHTRNNPIYTLAGEDRVIRGGSWRYNPNGLLITNRSYAPPVDRFFVIGFRLLKTL